MTESSIAYKKFSDLYRLKYKNLYLVAKYNPEYLLLFITMPSAMQAQITAEKNLLHKISFDVE